jgi:hypothetical protein
MEGERQRQRQRPGNTDSVRESEWVRVGETEWVSEREIERKRGPEYKWAWESESKTKNQRERERGRERKINNLTNISKILKRLFLHLLFYRAVVLFILTKHWPILIQFFTVEILYLRVYSKTVFWDVIIPGHVL